MIALAVVAGITLVVLDRRAGRQPSQQTVARVLERASPNAPTMTLIGIGGLLTAIGLEWGLYLVVPAVIAALVGGVFGAWLFMMSAGDAPSGSERQ